MLIGNIVQVIHLIVAIGMFYLMGYGFGSGKTWPLIPNAVFGVWAVILAKTCPLTILSNKFFLHAGGKTYPDAFHWLSDRIGLCVATIILMAIVSIPTIVGRVRGKRVSSPR